MEHDIQTKEIPAQLALTVHARVSLATIPEGMGKAFDALMAHAQAGGGQFAGPPFCLFPEPPGDDFGIVVCVPVAPGARAGEGVELEEIPGGHGGVDAAHRPLLSHGGYLPSHGGLDDGQRQAPRRTAARGLSERPCVGARERAAYRDRLAGSVGPDAPAAATAYAAA